MTSSSDKVFRKNVAIVVLNHEGKMLACHRSDRSGVWQLPQGGIDPGETEEMAMYRELEEEIGTRDVSLLGRLSQNIRYDWPPEYYSRGYHGQEQTYFIVRLHDSAKIDLIQAKPEFDKYEWVSWSEFLKRITGFKVEPYSRAIDKIREEFPELLSNE